MRLSIVTTLLAAAQPAFSWGAVGHRTVGYLAEKYLTTEARTLFIDTLLANDRNYDISDAAIWADGTARDVIKGSAAWHFINPKGDRPPSRCVLNYPDDCPEEGCIIEAIERFTGVVLNSTLPLIDRKNATMFLIHFIGDLHQPLHITGFEKGATLTKPVCWNREPRNNVCTGTQHLHGVWDTRIPHRIRGLPSSIQNTEEKTASATWATELYARQRSGGVSPTAECSGLDLKNCVIKWADESNKLVCDVALKPGVAWIKSHDLSEQYYDDVWETTESQIAKAGVRLGAWLNAIAARTPKMVLGDGEL